MQVEAAPAQAADVPPPAPVAVGDASEEEAEVGTHTLSINKEDVYLFIVLLGGVFGSERSHSSVHLFACGGDLWRM